MHFGRLRSIHNRTREMPSGENPAGKRLNRRIILRRRENRRRSCRLYGGERGIRTPGAPKGTTDFESYQGEAAPTLQNRKRNVFKLTALADSRVSNLKKCPPRQFTAQIRYRAVNSISVL